MNCILITYRMVSAEEIVIGMFAIVEFANCMGKKLISNHEVAVVPLQWLIHEEKKCYWPTKTVTGLSNIVSKLTTYKKTWPLYPVYKVHCKTESYITAKQKLSAVVKASISEQSDSGTDGNISSASLTLKVMEGYSSDNCDESDESVDLSNTLLGDNPTSEDPFPVQLEAIPYKRAKMSGRMAVIDSSSGVQSSANNVLEDVAAEIHSIASTSTLSVSSGHLSNLSRSDNDDKILNTLERIKTEMENHSLILNELLRTNRKINAEKLIPPPDLPVFPIRDNILFEDFNNTLLSVSGTYDYMVRRLAAVGGSNIQSTTRRILRFVLADEVAVLYNWKGRDKLSFEKTRVMAAIFDAAKLNYPTEDKSDHVIATSVKEWLKFAKTRMKRGNQN